MLRVSRRLCTLGSADVSNINLIILGGTSGIYLCLLVTSLCSYMLAAIFCIFILSFEKDYEYFSEVSMTFLNTMPLVLNDGLWAFCGSQILFATRI